MDRVSSGEILDYVFGFPRFRLRLKDFYKETQMKYDSDDRPLPGRQTTVPQNEKKYRSITSDELDKLQARLRAYEDRLLATKGQDYTRGNPDRLTNFIEDAQVLGISPEIAWAVHFRKQVAAVMTWAKTGRVESESLESRFVDIRNYCLLGLARDHAPRLPGEEESS